MAGDEVEAAAPEAFEDGQEQKISQTTSMEGDPTFEMANVRRFIIGKEPLSKLVANSREMFLLRVSTFIIYFMFLVFKSDLLGNRHALCLILKNTRRGQLLRCFQSFKKAIILK